MKKLRAFLHEFHLKNELFFKLLIVVIVSILSVTIVITFSLLRISKKSYITSYNQSNQVILKQIQNDYEQLNNSIINTLNFVENNRGVRDYLTTTSPDATTESNLIYQLQSQLERTQLLYREIPSNLIIIGVNGRNFYQNSAVRIMTDQELLFQDIIKQADQQPKQVFYQFVPKGLSSNTVNEPALVIVKVIQDVNHVTIGYALITLPESSFSVLYDNLIDPNLNQIYIFDQTGTTISSNLKSAIGKNIDHLKPSTKLPEQYKHFKEGLEVGSAFQFKNLYSYRFVLGSVINTDLLGKQMAILTPVLFVAFASIAIASLLAFYLIKKMTDPIYLLIKKIPRLTTGDFSQKIDVTGTHEIKKLVSTYNYMLDGMNLYTKQLIYTENQKRLAEIHALQMQIQPHFMYNTLTSIKFLIWQGNPEKSVAALDAFIRLLRHTVQVEDETIALSEELANVEDYVLILKIRYGDRIQVTVLSLLETQQILVPKMILQPIIENCFIHAFPEQESGTINLFISEHQQVLTIEIIDNGVGIAGDSFPTPPLPETRLKQNHFSGVGLRNIDHRIKLLYGDDFGLKTASTLGIGTTITLTIPLIEKT